MLAAVQTDVSSESNVVFNSSSTVFGTIGVTPLASPVFLNLSGGNNGTTDNFSGSVDATQLIVGGTGTVNFNSGSVNNVTNLIYGGDGAIGLGPNTTVNGALTTTAGAGTGLLSLAGGSVLNGAVGGAVGLRAVNVVGGSNIAGVNATVTGALDAFAFSLGTNTLNIGGALTIANQGPTGTIATTLSTPTVFGNIVAGGATNLGPLTITVTVPATAVFPVGTDFTIVRSGGTGTSGIIATVTDPTNPLYRFAQVPTPGSVTPGPTNATGFVVITTLSTPLQAVLVPPPGVVMPPVAPVVVAVATALIGAVQTPDIILVENVIDAFSDPAAVINAEKQLAPSASDVAAGLVTFQNTRQFQDLWFARIDDLACGDVNQAKLDDANGICRKNEPAAGWWVKSFGYFGSQGQQGSFDGYDSRTLGTMVAYDTPLPGLRDASRGVETRVGLGVGYAQTTINDNGFANSTNFNTYQATAYISHDQGPWFVDGDVSFGWSDYSEARNISFTGIGRRAQGDYSGQDYTAFGITGFRLPAGGVTVTPFASLQYTHVDLDGYTESGAGDVSLKVSAQSYDFIESGLGAKVTRPFAASGGSYVPEAHFKWLRDLLNPTLLNTASFTGGSPQFSTPGLKNSADTLNVGTGLTFLTCSCSANNWSLEAVYDYYWRPDNYSAHQGTVKFSARF